MSIYEIQNDRLKEINTTFKKEKFYEKSDLQRLLAKQIEILSKDILIISEEFCDWEDSKRRIDLLGLDKNGKIVVIELKRTLTGGHIDLQAIRYAAMVSSMNIDQIKSTYEKYLEKINNKELNAEEEIFRFVNEDYLEDIGSEVRIIFVSSEYSKEITSTVIWLNDNGLDIECFKIHPYKLDEKIIVELQKIIPLPESEDYIIKIKKKSNQQKEIKKSKRDTRQFDLKIGNRIKQKLPKRNLLLEVVKEAIRRGFTPAEINSCINWRKIWFEVEGEYSTQQEFISNAIAKNDKFNATRFFTQDDELIQHSRKTYSLSSHWGRRTEEAVKNIILKINSTDIKYNVHNEIQIE